MQENSKFYEMTGIVHKLGATQTFSSGFTKRELVLTNDIGDETKYPRFVPFSFKKQSAERLNGVCEGQRVKVLFAVDGREWNGRYFADLTGLKITVLGAADTDNVMVPEPAAPTTDIGADSASLDDMPF